MVKFPPTLTTLAEAVAYLLELSRARPMALIIDECQDLEGIAPNFWSQLQKVWGLGKNGAKLLLVMSGSLPSRLERIFGNRSEPQYGRSDVTQQPFSTETMRDVFALEGGDAGPGDFLLLCALIGGVARYVEYFVDNEAMTGKATLQLAKENKKFLYRLVKEGARAREYEEALQWLVDAGLAYKICRSTTPGLPFAAFDDVSSFKIYPVDVGLLRRLARLTPTAFAEGNRLFTELNGALTESFVLQSLVTQFEVTPRCWSQTNPPYAVNFLIQRENDIFPVEVSLEANAAGRGLKKFKALFPEQAKLLIRFSLDNLKLEKNVLNIPLFMADQTDRLIGLALRQLS